MKKSHETNSDRPTWYARRHIEPFTLSDAAANKIIEDATHAVVSWVTKDNQPVSAVMLYMVIDGVITLTSTTNRAKYHAWKRNPNACFCIWEPGNMGRQVTLRGTVSIKRDPDLLRQFSEGLLMLRSRGKPIPEQQLRAEVAKFDAPDRYMMQLTVEKTLTHDLNRLFEVENSGEDVWSS